jgi:hypothetical protein
VVLQRCRLVHSYRWQATCIQSANLISTLEPATSNYRISKNVRTAFLTAHIHKSGERRQMQADHSCAQKSILGAATLRSTKSIEGTRKATQAPDGPDMSQSDENKLFQADV